MQYGFYILNQSQNLSEVLEGAKQRNLCSEGVLIVRRASE